MSITEIVGAGNMDARAAALCGMAIEAHGSLLIAAEHPHSGKTTTLTALLDYLPTKARRIFVRGWSETFDFVQQTEPNETLLLVNELSSHLPVYLWGPKAVRLFNTLQRGYALGSTLHADSAEEALTQLTGELGVAPANLARVELLRVMRIYQTTQGHARRVVSIHELLRDGDAVEMRPLVTYDTDADTHVHDESAEAEMLARLRREEPSAAERELAKRAARLEALVAAGAFGIPEVREALASDRGERVPSQLRGDPVS